MRYKIYGTILCVLTALLAFGCMSASAAVIDTFEFETDSLTVNVEGSLGEEFSNTPVSLTVYKEGADLSALSGTEDVLNWYDQVKADADGDYSFSYIMSGESGTRYVASITVFGSAKADSRLFTYFDSSEAENIIDDVKEAIEKNDPSIIRDRIIENEDRVLYLQLDTTAYDALSLDISKLGVCRGIMKKAPKTAGEFTQALTNCSKVWCLNETANRDADGYTEMFNTIKGEDAKESDTLFEEFDSTEKTSVINSLMNTEFYTYEELINAYNTAVITKSVNDAVMWGDVYDVLEMVKDVLDIDFTKYNSLKNKEAVMRQFLKPVYTELATIKNDFDKWVDEEKDEESHRTPSIGGSGGGGGSGSFGGDTYYVPSQSKSEETKPASMFNDTESVPWALDAIEALAKNGVLQGDGKGNFNPNAPVTREEFAAIIVRSFELGENGENSNFSDVASDRWSYDEISKAYASGIIKGSDGKFMPVDNITRQDASVMLYRLTRVLGKELSTGECEFADKALISDYAVEAVNTLSGASIILGSDGKFMPLQFMTRAQAAVLIYRLHNI